MCATRWFKSSPGCANVRLDWKEQCILYLVHTYTHTRTSLTPTHFYFTYTVVTFTDLFKCMTDWQLNFTYQKHRYTNHPVQTACKSTRFQNSHHRHRVTFLFWYQRSWYWQVTTDIFCMNRKLKNSNKKQLWKQSVCHCSSARTRRFTHCWVRR